MAGKTLWPGGGHLPAPILGRGCGSEHLAMNFKSPGPAPSSPVPDGRRPGALAPRPPFSQASSEEALARERSRRRVSFERLRSPTISPDGLVSPRSSCPPPPIWASGPSAAALGPLVVAPNEMGATWARSAWFRADGDKRYGNPEHGRIPRSVREFPPRTCGPRCHGARANAASRAAGAGRWPESGPSPFHEFMPCTIRAARSHRPSASWPTEPRRSLCRRDSVQPAPIEELRRVRTRAAADR